MPALLLALVFAQAAQPEPKLTIYPAPQGEPASPDYTVAVEGREVFVYLAKVLHAGPASFAYFDFSGTVNVAVTAKRKVDSAVVRPLSAGIKPAVEGNTIRFSLSKPCNLSIELNGGIERPLLLFANPPEADPPKPGDPNVIYFGPGVHEVGTTRVPSGKTVYIAGGAVVRGKILPDEKPVQERNWAGNKVYTNLFILEKVTGVRFRGRGIMDMSTLPWHSKCPIVISGASDVQVEGIIIKDSPCWVVAMFGSKNVTVTNVKEVCHRENSDGIDIVNSQDVVVDGCFLRNNDDEICVKTCSPPPAGESKNIVVRNCVVWNDRAYGLGITYETRVNVSNVLFSNCDVIHDMGIASLAAHVSDSGTMSDIRFEDIRVEDTRNRLIRLWIGKDMWGHDPERGHIKGVSFRNVSVVGGPFPGSELSGSDDAHGIQGVTFDNLRVHGKAIRSLAEGKISARHATDIRFLAPDGPQGVAPGK